MRLTALAVVLRAMISTSCFISPFASSWPASGAALPQLPPCVTVTAALAAARDRVASLALSLRLCAAGAGTGVCGQWQR